MMPSLGHTFGTGVFAAAVLSAGSVAAQVAPEAAGPTAPPLAIEDDQQQSPGEVLGDIVVTAQKRSESAQRIPVSVSALGAETLRQNGVKDLFQAVTLVPGVVFSRAPDDGLALTFRGLGTQARPQAFEQSVALFTNGVFLGKTRLYSTSFFDLDRMEFIKGTQSTLLGKNASLGAISIVTREPGDRFAAQASGGVEFQNGGYQLDAGVDVPLGENATIRVAGHYNDLDGWVRNTATGRKGPEQRDLGLRATAVFKPSDTLRLTALLQYSNNQQFGASYQIVGDVDARFGEGRLDDRTAQLTSYTPDGDTFHRTRSLIASGRAELDLGSHTLVSQTAYVGYDLYFLDDFDFTVDDSINLRRDERYRQSSQEFRIQSAVGGTLEYMAGVFYLASDWDSLEGQLWAVPQFPPPPSPIAGQLFRGPFFNQFDQDSRTYSAFASGTWNLASSVRVAGGLRYTRETKDVVFTRTNAPPITIWNTLANPPFDPTNLRHRSSFLDGNVSLQVDLAQRVMAYAAYGHGSKSGGFVETNSIAVDPALLVKGKVPAPLVAAGAAIKDEFTNSFEAGLKSTFLDQRLRFNLAVFHVRLKDFQDTVFTGGPLGFITYNGPARSSGLEVESAFQVTHGLRLDATATYADATQVLQPINDLGNPLFDPQGDPVLGRFRRSQAPKLIFNLGAEYQRDLAADLVGRVGARVRYRGAMFNQRQERFRSDPLTTLDLSAGLKRPGGAWALDLVARNVTNSISQDFASPPTDPRLAPAYLAGPNAQRTVLLTASFSY